MAGVLGGLLAACAAGGWFWWLLLSSTRWNGENGYKKSFWQKLTNTTATSEDFPKLSEG